MIPKAIPLAILLALPASLAAQTGGSAGQPPQVPAAQPSPTSVSFDSGWRFFKGDADGAQAPAFDDAAWRKVDLPHDWSIEGPYDQAATTLRGGGFLPAGIGWYRKTFTVLAEAQGKKIFVDFDGIMANSEVWINGQSLGKRPYGYIWFRRDLTPHLKFDGPNVIAVRCDNTAQPASRWYAGAGIYRHTRLAIANPLHLQQWATQVTTPQVKGEQAVVRVRTSVANDSAAPVDAAVVITLRDPQGSTLKTETLPARQIAAGNAGAFEHEFAVEWPKFWDIGAGNLYTATVAVLAAGRQVDSEQTPFGIRIAEWKGETGFWLNGQNVKLKGVCLHHDGGAVGAAVPLSIWERRLLAMRDMGANAVRTAHNPMAPEFYDLCDRMGFLVMDESFDTWTAAKPNGGQGYNRLFNDWWQPDTRDIVLRNRNHPSIVIWSCGNEIRDNLLTPDGRNRFIGLRDIYHALDPLDEGGRPVTFALFRPGLQTHYADGGFVDLMDVVGQNYNETNLLAGWKVKPSRKILGTENGHTRAAWLAVRDNPSYAGQFLWTGVDYLGEADWPRIGSNSGLVDRIGMPRARAFERQAWWSDKPVVHIARREGAAAPAGENQQAPAVYVCNWTPREGPAGAAPGAPTDVQVFSNCDEVDLLLNGKSLGAKPKNVDDAPRAWRVPFEVGTLLAMAKNQGKEVAREELRTAGTPARIALRSDRDQLTTSFDDVALVYVSLQDANGTENPNASDAVTFQVSGPGALVAVDNADAADHTTYAQPTRKLFNGRAAAIVRATGPGTIQVQATVPGHPAAQVTIASPGR
jgi:beta-galactosidase